MAIKTILTEPNKILRQVSKRVEKVGEEEKKIMDDMLETMYAAPGIGLAATQINVHKRVLVMDVTEEKNSPMSFINPEIEIIDADLGEFSEGCLSVPGFFEIVNRPKSIRVKSLDPNGKEKIQELEGLSAICLQHEVDHLNGKLFVDYISPLKRGLIRKKLQKAQKQRT